MSSSNPTRHNGKQDQDETRRSSMSINIWIVLVFFALGLTAGKLVNRYKRSNPVVTGQTHNAHPVDQIPTQTQTDEWKFSKAKTDPPAIPKQIYPPPSYIDSYSYTRGKARETDKVVKQTVSVHKPEQILFPPPPSPSLQRASHKSAKGMGKKSERKTFRKERCVQKPYNVGSIMSYKTMYDAFTNYLKCGKHFAFVRYAHEADFILGEPYSVARHTGQFLGIPLQPYEGGYQLLRNDILSSLEVEDESFYYGVPIPPCKDELNVKDSVLGGDMERLMVLLSQLKEVDIVQLAYSSIFTYLNFDRSQIFFENLLLHHPQAYLVTYMPSVNLNGDLWTQKLIQIPSDAIQHYGVRRQAVIERVESFVTKFEEVDEPVVLVSVGALGGILIHHMYQANKNVTYVDVDGLLDRSHRLYIKRPKMQYLQNSTLSGSESEQAQCMDTQYEREGDCVKALNERHLSKLCYPKGSKGKPKARKIKKFFALDYERKRAKKEALEKEKKERLEKERLEKEALKKELERQKQEASEKEALEKEALEKAALEEEKSSNSTMTQ